MTFTVEVLLRDTDIPVVETVDVVDRAPEAWTDGDVRAVLEAMLQMIGRVKDPAGERRRPVAFRGLSWIVDGVENGVMIAIEIPSGAVAAGPFDIARERLEAMVGRVIASASGTPVVH
jgi:hypothetical protein